MTYSSRPRPYLFETLTGSRKQLELIDSATLGLGYDTKAMLSHLVASTLRRLSEKREGYLEIPYRSPPRVPLPSLFIRKTSPGANWRALRERGVLTVHGHDRKLHRCREFSLTAEWLTRYLDARLQPDFTREADLFGIPSGRPSNARLKSWLSLRPRSELVERAGRSIRRSLYNREQVELHLSELRSSADSTGEHGWVGMLRWMNDEACYNTILGQRATLCSGDVWSYTPAYTKQRFGRISERGGGLQSCSRLMKAAARRGVPDCHNYDLADSQPRLLVVLMEAAGIPARWLRAYLSHEKRKSHYAARSGLSVGAWKSALYAVLMGARVPTVGQLGFSEGALKDIVETDAGRDALPEIYSRFLDTVAPLLEELRPFHDYLVGDWLAENGHYMAPQNRTYVHNATGLSIALESLSPERKRHELKTQLSAFLLQGMEAAVVHRLVIYGHEYGYETMSHEHDGIVTLGVVPPAAVARAAEESGVPIEAVRLVEKPFA